MRALFNLRVLGLVGAGWWMGVACSVGNEVRDELLGRLEAGNLVFSTDPERAGVERFEMWVETEKGGEMGAAWWLHGDGERSAIVQVHHGERIPMFLAAGDLSTVHSLRLPGMMETVLGVASRFEFNEEGVQMSYFSVGRERERWVEIENDVLESKVLRALRVGAPVVKREVDGVEYFWVYGANSRVGLMMSREEGVSPVRCMVADGRDGERFWIWIGEPREGVEPVSLAKLRNVGLMSRVRNLYRWRARTEGWNSRERSVQEKGVAQMEVALEALMRSGRELAPEVVDRFRGVLEAAGWRGMPEDPGREVLVTEPWVEVERAEPFLRELWECRMEFPEGEDQLVVPISWWWNCPVVTLTIDGETVERVLLDTGAERTVLAESVASFDGDWSTSTTNRLSGVGGDHALETREIGTLEVGGIGTSLERVAVAKLEERLELGGFLGRDLLGTVPFTVDPEMGQVVFYRPSRFSPPEGALKVAMLETDDERPVVEIEFGSGEERLRCLPDTGFSDWLSVGEATFDARTEPEWVERRMYGKTFGPFGSVVTGEVRLREEREEEVKVFGRELRDGVIDVHADEDKGGVIGMRVLGEYRVTYDFRGRAMYLEEVEKSGIPRGSGLHEAVKRGNVGEVERRLEAGEVPDREAVVEAVTSGQVDVLRLFDERAPGVWSERREGAESAAFRGDVAMVEYLLEWGVDGSERRNGFSLLGPALTAGDEEMVKFLLGRGVAASPEDVVAMLSPGGKGGLAAMVLEKMGEGLLGEHVPDELLNGDQGVPWLSLAARNSSGEAVRFFLERGDAIDGRAGNGMTALMMAAAVGNREVVEVLLEAGADVTQELKGSVGVLSTTVQLGEATMLEWLLDREEIRGLAAGKDGARAVRLAVGQGSAEKVKALVEAGADTQTDGGFGVKVLPLAAGLMLKAAVAANGESEKEDKLAGMVEVVAFLIGAGAPFEGVVGTSGYSVPESLAGDPRTLALMQGDVGVSGESRERALVVATATGTGPAVEFLLSRGVELKEGGAVVNGKDPIYDAVVGGYVEVLELLLEHGADAAGRMGDVGKRPLIHLAAGNRDPYSIRALVGKGADVNARDADDATALMRAVEARGWSAVEALIELGADVAAKDWLGRDALELARRLDPADERLVDLLEKAAAK